MQKKKTVKYHKCVFVVWRNANYRAHSYHGDHAVVLFPGAAAAEEGDEENDHPDGNDDDGRS